MLSRIVLPSMITTQMNQPLSSFLCMGQSYLAAITFEVDCLLVDRTSEGMDQSRIDNLICKRILIARCSITSPGRWLPHNLRRRKNSAIAPYQTPIRCFLFHVAKVWGRETCKEAD